MRRLQTGAAIAVAVVIVACGGGPTKPPAAPVSDRCPDLSKGDDLAAFDFAKEFALSRDAADKLKAAILAAIEIGQLSDRLDADLGIACAQIAHDLGNKGDYHSSAETCAAAIKAVQEARTHLGPKANVMLVVNQPVCLVDTALVTKCASLCDSSVPSSKVRAECMQTAGRCEGNCDGNCEPKGTPKCDGTCIGTCEGPIHGVCGGRCVGSCDGKRVNGGCLGICTGQCQNGAIEGECKGQCTGACKFTKPSICDGVCSGKCTVELTEEKCAGDFKPPEVSTDCRARCDLAVMNKTECSLPVASYVVTGAKPVDADQMKSAIDKAFPALLKIIAETGPQGSKRVMTGSQVIESVRTNLKELAHSGGNPSGSESAMTKCFDDVFKKAVAAGAAAKTGIDQAVAVRDEATKSAAP